MIPRLLADRNFPMVIAMIAATASLAGAGLGVAAALAVDRWWPAWVPIEWEGVE